MGKIMAASFNDFVTNYKKDGFLHFPATEHKKLLLAIYNGDVAFFTNFTWPFDEAGILSQDSVRQLQLLAVCNCTLGSNFAVLRNVDTEFVLSLSDYYIQLSQTLTDISALTKLIKDITCLFTQIIHDHLTVAYPPAIQSQAQFIIDHLYSSLRIEDVANHFSMTPSYLSKMFKHAMGQSIKDFMHTAKLKEAKNLMLYTDMSLTEIAMYLGYSDSSHFTKTCKKYTGKTPSELKKDIDRDPLQ